MSSPSAIFLESNKQSSPSPSPSPSGKLCIVSTFDSNGSYYAVFIVDLESPAAVGAADVDLGFIPSAPTILIDRTSMGDSDQYAFCVLDSTLYLFESCSPAFPHRRGKSVYTYDLSSHLKKPNSTVIVDKTKLKPRPEMLRFKVRTCATPTPDGKGILLLSSDIEYDPSVDPLDSEFELYHPTLQKELPSLKDYLKQIGVKSDIFGICFFAFISNSVFLIHIKFGVFTIDIDMPDPVWKKRSDRINCAGMYDVIEIKDDTLWVTDRGAYHFSNGVGDMFDLIKVSPIQAMSSFGDRFKFKEPLSLRMCTIHDSQENVFGIVKLQLGINERNLCAYMILDVISFDLDKYRNMTDQKTAGAGALLESRKPVLFGLHTIYDRRGNVFGIVNSQLGISKHSLYVLK